MPKGSVQIEQSTASRPLIKLYALRGCWEGMNGSMVECVDDAQRMLWILKWSD